MRLDPEQRELVGAARIGMLALGGRSSLRGTPPRPEAGMNAASRRPPTPPMVTPAAFHLGGDTIWMTTSRYAAKVALARRDPRAAFLVPPTRDAYGILLQGLLETYDPLSPRSQLRAILQGPGFAFNLAGYAIKNAGYIAGYLLDVPRTPTRWWPHNRLLLRLRPDRVSLVAPLALPPALPLRVPGPPALVGQVVGRHPEAHICWLSSGRPVLAGVAWSLDERDALVWLPGRTPRPPRDGGPAALVVEHRHPFRASRMVGICLRGHMRPDPSAQLAIERRYSIPRAPGGVAGAAGRGESLVSEGVTFRLEAVRLTWWRGFEVRSRSLARRVEPERAAR